MPVAQGGSKITQSQSQILNDLPVPELQSSFREAWLGGLSGRLFGDTWLSVKIPVSLPSTVNSHYLG